MNVSVIIPTLNAAESIGELLDRLLSQTLPPSDITVIDSSSEDDTVDIAKKKGAKTISLDRRNFSHGGARNMAAGKADGEVLVFMTQDALPYDENLLELLTKPLSDPLIAASYGRHIPYPDASLAEVFARGFNYPEKSCIKALKDTDVLGIKTFFFSNTCSAIRRADFLRAGMFPEDVSANEDMVLAAKLITKGCSIAYVSDAKVIHSHNYSLSSLFRRYYNIGLSLKKHKWVREYAAPEGEGLKFIKEQAMFIAGRKKLSLLPYILAEAVAKYIGYRLGLLSG